MRIDDDSVTAKRCKEENRKETASLSFLTTATTKTITTATATAAATTTAMALPSAFVNLVDTHGASLQNLALLAYLRKGEEAKPFLEGVTAARAYVDMNR